MAIKKNTNYYKGIIVFLLFLFLATILYYYYYYYYKETFSNDDNTGFIVTRHVNSEHVNKFWKKCINQIRKYYPTNKIVIIDDNSNYEFIDKDGVDLTNCEVIQSEYHKRGELLPYYYYYKNKWFDRAIFIHDSVFINNKLKTDDVENVKFIWHFEKGEYGYDNEKRLLSFLNYKDELLDNLLKENKWKGCFGTMSVIEHNYLVHLTEKYNLTELVKHTEGRNDRISIEVVFGIVCNHDKSQLINNPSIYGDIDNPLDNRNNRADVEYTFEQYEEDVNNGNMKADINKLCLKR
jgi:hypothetical protein